MIHTYSTSHAGQLYITDGGDLWCDKFNLREILKSTCCSDNSYLHTPPDPPILEGSHVMVLNFLCVLLNDNQF